MQKPIFEDTKGLSKQPRMAVLSTCPDSLHESFMIQNTNESEFANHKQSVILGLGTPEMA